jgi:hypothetical protein
VKNLLILAATAAAALTIGVATSGATTETPNGYCGAANMLNAWPGGGANVPNGGGMQNAMAVNNANGNNGCSAQSRPPRAERSASEGRPAMKRLLALDATADRQI